MGKIIDETGATRHTMTREELKRLYNGIDKFIADSTTDEFFVNKQALTQIKTMIHQRMRTADN